jgi:hypothetical protein
MYFTDPGELSSTVSHAQADAMVVAAAAVWNVPTANLTLAQGGELAEHVIADGSAPNSYFNGTDVVFPADVEATNYQAIQIAVIYDSDGSITDLLLGSGASDPSGCLQNGVSESVDSFGTNATIEHAVIVLNGLCVGSNAQQLEQMQYQLTRVFGRVLGLAWSQLNDNVFTGVSQVTTAQMALWPLMHPIDVICGTYTYQCMQNPFTLRPEDVAALAALYPVTMTTSTKTQSSLDAISASGSVNFPTGQGMELVNVTVTRMLIGVDGGYEPYPILSSTTGYPFQQNGGNPVSGPEPASENGGVDVASDAGAWSMAYIPAGTGTDNLNFATETINPLYSGEYAVGPYQRPVITISGWPRTYILTGVSQGTSILAAITQEDAVWSWCMYPDGTETNPVASSATGWWSELLCSAGYTAWRTTSVNTNTSWTIEMTAVDETGAATVQKLQPVIGVWNASDPTGTLPTVASQAAALNSMSLGMTQLQIPATASASTVRIALADQFGAGRPDFAYNARILYASSVSPATLGAAGGQITITGTGFQLGNQVTINGVAATVLSWTSTQIVATAPLMAAAGASSGTAVDVVVTDASTGGTTDMQAAFTYVEGTINQIALVSAPASLEVGYVAATPFAVRVYAPDGATPVAGASVAFVIVGNGGGAAVATGCGSGPGCVVTTDATGLAQTPLMGVAAGSVTVSGTEKSGGGSVRATIADANPVQTVAIGAVPEYLAAGASDSWSVSLTATQDGAAAAGVPVVWSTAAAGFTLTPANGCDRGEGNVFGGGAGECDRQRFDQCRYGMRVEQRLRELDGVWRGSAPVGGYCCERSGAECGVRCVAGAGGVAGDRWRRPCAAGGDGEYLPDCLRVGGGLPCSGPCAGAPVLTTSRSSAISNGSGLVQVQALEVPGVAQVVKIAASTGTQGFATTSLTVTP